MGLLCHPYITTVNLSYRFPIFETSATALCGTTGTCNRLTFFIGFSLNMILGANDLCQLNRWADADAPRMDLSCAASVPDVLGWSHQSPAPTWLRDSWPSWSWKQTARFGLKHQNPGWRHAPRHQTSTQTAAKQLKTVVDVPLRRNKNAPEHLFCCTFQNKTRQRNKPSDLLVFGVFSFFLRPGFLADENARAQSSSQFRLGWNRKPSHIQQTQTLVSRRHTLEASIKSWIHQCGSSRCHQKQIWNQEAIFRQLPPLHRLPHPHHKWSHGYNFVYISRKFHIPLATWGCFHPKKCINGIYCAILVPLGCRGNNHMMQFGQTPHVSNRIRTPSQFPSFVAAALSAAFGTSPAGYPSMACRALALHLWSCNVPGGETEPRLCPSCLAHCQCGMSLRISITNTRFCRTCWLKDVCSLLFCIVAGARGAPTWQLHRCIWFAVSNSKDNGFLNNVFKV